MHLQEKELPSSAPPGASNPTELSGPTPAGLLTRSRGSLFSEAHAVLWNTHGKFVFSFGMCLIFLIFDIFLLFQNKENNSLQKVMWLLAAPSPRSCSISTFLSYRGRGEQSTSNARFVLFPPSSLHALLQHSRVVHSKPTDRENNSGLKSTRNSPKSPPSYSLLPLALLCPFKTSAGSCQSCSERSSPCCLSTNGPSSLQTATPTPP